MVASARDLQTDEKYEEALAEYERALAFGMEEPFLRGRMAMYRRLNRFSEALADAKLVSELFPYSTLKNPVKNMLEAYRNWAYDRQREDNLEPAIEAFTELIEYLPNDVDLHYWRAVALRKSGQPEAALEGFQAAMAVDPHRIDSFRGADFLLALQKRWGEVISIWDAFILDNPDVAEGYFERGGANFNRGDFASALNDAQKACDLGRSEACEWVSRLSKHRQ